MKSFPKSLRRSLLLLGAVSAAIVGAGWMVLNGSPLPSWIRNIEARTGIEAAFFRLMSLPGGEVLYRRPPRETRAALAALINIQPKEFELYSLRALEDEQQLDFAAAETDWKLYAKNSPDQGAASLALADFYSRRLRPLDEIKELSSVANAPKQPSEKFTPVQNQRSWRAFDRIFGVIRTQRLSKDISIANYRRWLARYPLEQSLYPRFLEFLLSQKEYEASRQLIEDYRKQFPKDEIFPVKAEALVEYRKGSLPQGLAVYEKSFQPLWAPELIKSYFDLLAQTHGLRKFLDEARAAVNAHPEDLNATARIFYYYQQQGKLDAAQQSISQFRLHKDANQSVWTAQELYVCARLLQGIHVYPEAARYYFALYNSKGMNDGPERALGGLADLLLTAPETPIQLGAGELSLYRDIATMDQGPGYLNGILSLILNTTYPPGAFMDEEQRAVSYFHRSRAAQLLTLLDGRFPNSPQRPGLHARLLEFYSTSGESEAVIRGGADFLAAFPKASQRTQVALLMADAYARTRKTQEEFAIYDAVLQELAVKADQMPLGTGAQGVEPPAPDSEGASSEAANSEQEAEEEAPESGNPRQPIPRGKNTAFQVESKTTPTQVGARSPEYARILERYLARLVELKEIPQALAVLRREIDHNPDDPGLYERLAVFLEQNRLGAEQEEIYRRAIARFPDRSWYHKLARYYLRHEKAVAFGRLTQQVVSIFKGSELEEYFRSLVGGGPALYLSLNQYAIERFPHNPVFVHNLLNAYRQRETLNPAAWEALLRQHWFEESDLRSEFFEYLTRTGKFESELRLLRKTAAGKDPWEAFVERNPAAGHFLAEAELWRSHYEDSAPVLKALSDVYPADAELGHMASSVFRSLAYFDPTKTSVAVGIENHLLEMNPGSTEILARIGDIYADRELFAQAAPYWERIPRVAPGQSGGYLEAATIYWDYFDFDNALRLLMEGRKQLGDEDLYAYETAALYEGKRDYSRAIHEYVRGVLATGGNSPAQDRLLELARRPKFRELVDRETSDATVAAGFSLPSVSLRVRVLEAQNRKQDLTELLESAVTRATTIEQAADIETLAQQKSLETVRQHALEKEAALATDPVTRLQLRYSLVHLYESRKDLASAQRNVEALYRENPRILGVVRATVDFYWRAKQYPQSIDALRQASKDAYPELGKQFTYEAARKSTEARLFQQARDLLSQLLKESPYDGQYLAATADTYAQAGDSQGLKQFYLDEIPLFRAAPFSADERKTRIASLRRGLIPALTRLEDYPGAVDQYIELINGFPEDEGLTTEAALYATRYKRQAQLVGFYSKTIQQSPQDFRWPMVLARIQTSLEDFPAAIDAYANALKIRPDRVDLFTARAALEERLMRFDDAIGDYEHLYQLAYKDPKWMEKIAEVRARQGKADEAVAALRAALIDGRPERADKYFEAAHRLESWGLLTQARLFAEQGVNVAAGDLLTVTENHAGATLYARLMTRLRLQEKAYTTLQSALSSASSVLPVIKEQVAREPIAAVTDREWRQRVQETRIQNARTGMAGALKEMGSTVARYFTPEEKSSFAQLAQKLRGPMSSADVGAFALPLVESAGLTDLEAIWRYERMMEADLPSGMLIGQMYPYVELQRSRVKFGDLGKQLERFAPRIEDMQRPSVLLTAAAAYRSAGNVENELRVLTQASPTYMSRDVQNRFLELMLTRRPVELAAMASEWTPWGEQAADFGVAHGELALAHAIVLARSQPRPAVWSRAYHALIGLYFAEPAPGVSKDFLAALGDQTIGERLGKAVNRNEQLAGDLWFYYGSRFGEYLGVTKQPRAEDFLPAELEHSPATASGYLALADYYADSGNTHAAIGDYNHTLELAPGRANVHDRLALSYYKQGSRGEAITQWKQAFSTLSRQVSSSRVPESFWGDFARFCDHLGTRRLLADLKPEVDALLRAYLHRNGTYRSNALLRSAYLAAGDPVAATAWLLDVVSVAPNPTAVLTDVADVPWIPLAQRAPIYRRILEAKQDAAAKSEGFERDTAREELRSWQVRWLKYLIQTKQFSLASDFMTSLPEDMQKARVSALAPLELQVAARLGTLDTRIAAFRSDSTSAPPSEVLRTAARLLFEGGDKLSARKVLEFVFTREIDEHRLVATNFLGLAEIRLAAADTVGAVDLLRRLVAVVGTPFENLDPAAALLEKTGHPAEAVEFLDQLVKATPWEPSFRLRLAKAKIAAAQEVNSARDTLAGIASSSEFPYRTRVEAVMALAGSRPTFEFGSRELQLLGGDPHGVSVAAVDHPFFYDARLKAAENETDSRAKIELLGKALADFPARETARVPLFLAAWQSHADEFALAVIEPLLRGQILQRLPISENAGEEEIISSEEGESSQVEQQSLNSAPSSLPPQQRVQVLWSVADVLVRLGRLQEALPYLTLAQKLEKAAPRRKEISTRITGVKSRLRRQQTNLSRQPILHEGLEQDRLVRPRLIAQVATPAKAAAKGGVRP